MSCDVAVIGGGIVGVAVARALQVRRRCSIVVLEAEAQLASHQTGHNSGVIHSGLYYKPGSLKARNCVEGREELYRFCREHALPHDACGKIVVATSGEEIEPLRELERRGLANGLAGIERLDPQGLRRHEPHVTGVEGLWVPQTGIVDYRSVLAAMVGELRERGAEIRMGARVSAVGRQGEHFTLHYKTGKLRAGHVINCAGLHSDRVARLCGVQPDLRIVPVRGEYYALIPERTYLVRNLIYPVPDPRLPFLGVHFTRSIHGGVEAGPSAVLSLSRHGYRRLSFSARDAVGILSYGGFWRLCARHYRTGGAELRRSFSKSIFARDLRRLVPDVQPLDLVPKGAGVRAQAVGRDGSLLDDFRVLESERMLHILNAPSPAATACLSLGRMIAERADRAFELR